ncbi:MAG TPA: holo-ACP synthase [Anaerolineales bacterium]|nr:holo-ACP synthase [Anaerolineales bacterium]
MAHLTNGVDLIEISRISQAIDRHGERFLRRIFTSKELALVGDKPASLAARFAAKEAVAKALGCGIGDVRWTEIEVLRGPNNQPELHLHGNARQLANQLGYHTWSISLSHSINFAIAMVTAMSE